MSLSGQKPPYPEVSAQRDMSLNGSERPNGNGNYPNNIAHLSEDDWENFVQKHKQEWLGFIFKEGCDRNEAEDVLQEMLFKIWNYPEKNKIVNLKYFIFTVLRNIILDIKRKSSRTMLVSIEQENGDGLTIEHLLKSLSQDSLESLISRKQIEIIQQEVSALPEKLRDAITLYINDVAEQDAAEQLKITLQGYRARVFRAKNTLEKKLMELGVQIARNKGARHKKSA